MSIDQLRRILGTALHFAALFFTIRLTVLGGFDEGFTAACLLLSGMWLALTWLWLNAYLNAYANVVARLRVLLPVWAGIAASIFVLVSSDPGAFTALGVISLLGWSVIYARYRNKRRLHHIVGHGPLLDGVWLNVPLEELRTGDVVITGGGRNDMSTITRASGEHAEMIIEGMDPTDAETYGVKFMFSVWMVPGMIREFAEIGLAKYAHVGHYFIMRPAQELSERQKRILWDVASQMLQQNLAYREKRVQRFKKAEARYERIVPGFIRKTLSWGFNHLPAALKGTLEMALGPDNGYDWRGLINGRMNKDRWTCIGAVVRLYDSAGIDLGPMGEGMLKLGTGFGSPLTVSSFRKQKSFIYLMEPGYTPQPEKKPGIPDYLAASPLALIDILRVVRRRVVRILKPRRKGKGKGKKETG